MFLGSWEPAMLWREDMAKAGLGLDLPRDRAVSQSLTHCMATGEQTSPGPLPQPFSALAPGLGNSLWAQSGAGSPGQVLHGLGIAKRP